MHTSGAPHENRSPRPESAKLQLLWHPSQRTRHDSSTSPIGTTVKRSALSTGRLKDLCFAKGMDLLGTPRGSDNSTVLARTGFMQWESCLSGRIWRKPSSVEAQLTRTPVSTAATRAKPHTNASTVCPPPAAEILGRPHCVWSPNIQMPPAASTRPEWAKPAATPMIAGQFSGRSSSRGQVSVLTSLASRPHWPVVLDPQARTAPSLRRSRAWLHPQLTDMT
mmetsp:Transcript_84448/g.225657  ORF Transcript_84448/g.225657 Transcript_84448/m.225657 type:complete len:222 (+) Transcript_84448:1206-1871(+)